MLAKSVVIIGAGGLGSVVAMALAEAGIGSLTLVDPDTVALSNLHRQLLYQEADVGSAKVHAAASHLRRAHAHIAVETLEWRVSTVDQLLPLALRHDIVVDGSDNFTTRFLANDAALVANRPLVHGAATGLKGQLLTIVPWQSACLRCLFAGPPDTDAPSCEESGILGPVVMEIGWLMAMEVVKLIKKEVSVRTNRMFTVDLATGIRRDVSLARQLDCRGCGADGMTIHEKKVAALWQTSSTA